MLCLIELAMEPIEKSQMYKHSPPGTPDRLKLTLKVFEIFLMVFEPRSIESTVSAS
jgi:hypothetical protein